MPEVLHAVADRVRLTPNAQACRFLGTSLSYQELWDRSGAIAERLGSLGAGSTSTVGVHLPRSLDLVCSLVGALRARCVVVPLDVSYPADRLRYMCADAAVSLVIGHDDSPQRLGLRAAVTRDGALVYAAGGAGRVSAANEDLAYIVYTSGSTGRPKGVRYEYGNLANLIAWQMAASRCGAGERTLQFSPASFDVVFQEILTTLGEGGTVVCCTDEHRLDPQLLWDLIAEERINRLFIPFVMIQALAVFADEVSPRTHPLREILTSGEQVQCNSTIRAMFAALPDCRLVNQWGTTETHVATSFTLPEDVASWPSLPSIGTAITGSRVDVRRDDGSVAAVGEIGELWIAGDCVGPGYLNLPEQTERSYVPDPDDPSGRAYRTGDLGRVGEDGLLEFLGRRDRQVKVRGFRVELGEIETAIASFPGVAEAVVTVAGSLAEDRYLQAFVVPRDGELDPGEIVSVLRETLPEYMVPARIETVSELPRTPSGKVDRKLLVDGLTP
ncbi:amino acid adenylation domain-containing protein [Micromonospora sp. NPDC050276]|uniref:amino acid adenylation domain-containing protein n=1 Tax=Micromonospora sp. NPDC050276 TaxID=3364278 RepID=UPI00378EF390